jgi:chorismate-pyruvate lyase
MAQKFIIQSSSLFKIVFVSRETIVQRGERKQRKNSKREKGVLFREVSLEKSTAPLLVKHSDIRVQGKSDTRLLQHKLA